MGRGGLLTFFLLATAKCITNFSNCNYVVGSCNTTCNYAVIFSIKFQLRCRRFWHNLQLVVIFSFKIQLLRRLFKDNLQLRCRLLWRNLQLRCFPPDQVPSTLLTFVTQLATTLLSSFLSYWYYWCSMACIKELHSQQFVLPKPRFTVARKILAMEVHKPQCHFAAADDWSIKTHLLTKQCCFSDSTKTIRWKWAFTVVKRENAQISVSIFWDVFHERNVCFATYSFFEKHVLLRTWFPVRWEIYASDPSNSKPTKRTTIWTLTLRPKKVS